jgi:hypothetical protein
MQLAEAYDEGDKLLDQWATIKSEKQGQDQEETKLYGKPKQGKIPEDIRRYIDEFKLINAFLEDKDQVIQNVRWIAEQVKTVKDNEKLEELKQALAAVEQGGGFPKAVVIPMGILPSEVFLRFTAEAVMDDYGAGVVHGELSHRLQWAAIIHYIRDNKDSFSHTPWELYKQMSSPPFSGGRFTPGSSMWGATVDANTLQHGNNYHSPATLNRDLLESVPEEHDAHHGHSEKFPLPERPKDYAPPKHLAKMAPIGIALSLLREERVRQELEATGKDELPEDSLDAEANGLMGVSQWSGVPSEINSKHTSEDMLESGKFEIVDEGSASSERSAFDPKDQVVEPKQWMILKEK